MILVLLVLSLAASWLAFQLLIPRLKASGLTGRDLHKPDHPEVPEMGGLGIVSGFIAGTLFAVAIDTFTRLLPVDSVALLGVLATVLIITLIGILDDLLGISQGVKAFLPILAAFPLVVIEVGQTAMTIPVIGRVEFGVAYALVLVPVGITGAANAANMLAGFNGIEVGLGLVALGSLSVIAASLNAITALIILSAGIGALLAALYFNWYPARVLVGDVGTLSIGAILASAVIIGNFETAGVIVIIPYVLDFLFKAFNGFPSHGWWGELGQDGKLYCPGRRPVSLPQFIMKLAGGVREKHLAVMLMGMELVFGLIAIGLYAW